MTIPSLGRLEPVPLREAWTREDHQFTPWLASEKNLGFLGETLGIDLELEGVEERVGPFRADILCKDTKEDRLILIENQLERSDHTHLGQLITYTAGLDTATIVWIAAEITDEHRAALDWLNEATDEKFQFFGLEIQLWRIGSSPLAPSFKIISSPNEWTKEAKKASRAVQSGELTELGQKRLAYWTAFKDFVDAKGSDIPLEQPAASGHLRLKLPNNPFAVTIYRSTKGPGIFIRVPAGTQHDFAERLRPHKEAIDTAAGEDFLRLETTYESRLFKLDLAPADCEDEADWPRQFQWLLGEAQRYLEIVVLANRLIGADED